MEHRKDQFKIFGVAPEIQKLDFNRYLMVFRCDLGEKTAWYYENKGEFWADFATLSTSPLGEPDQESEAIPGEDYANMRMTSQELKYIQGKDDPVVEFTYQTLTDTFVSERDDKVDYELNGLRRVTRSVIAVEGTDYTNAVGTATISHTDHGQVNKTMYLASVEEYQKAADEGGFTRFVETWVESGILSVQTLLVGGNQRVTVSAIKMTSSEVDTELSAVTDGHVLINEETSNYGGIATSNYTYEVDDFETISYTETNLKMVDRVELSTDAFDEDADTIGTTTYLTTPTLYLATESIDNGNTIKRRQTKWLEAGKLFEKEGNPSDGIKQMTTGWWHTIGTTVGPIIAKDTQNYLGFKVFTITTITAPDGTDITDGNNDKKVADYETLVSWTRPGILAIKEEQRLDSNLSTIVDTWQKAPVQMNIRAHVEIYFSKSGDISDTDFDDITSGTDVALWNPDEWVTLEGAGQGSADAASFNRTYRGFRAVDSTDDIYNITPPETGTYTYYSGTGSAKTGYISSGSGLSFGAGWFGKFYTYFGNPDGTVVAIASLVGGPPKPEGKTWMIDVQSTKAFTDVDGVDYYKKTYVWSYIPDFENNEDIWDDAP